MQTKTRLSLLNKKWTYASPDPEKAKAIQKKENLDPVIVQILLNRGIDTEQKIEEFLRPSLEDLSPLENIQNIEAAAKNKIEGAVSRLKEALKTENLEEIKSASEALNQVWSEASSNLYQQPGPPPGGAAQESASTAESAGSADEKVEEADYEVVDDDKKDKKDKN